MIRSDLEVWYRDCEEFDADREGWRERGMAREGVRIEKERHPGAGLPLHVGGVQPSGIER